MGNRREGPQPALMLMYSQAANSVRPLNREATIIGRARNCDIVLDAADISTLHCVITRNSGGFSVRDCGSRAGIRLNGDNITEATLHDGDVFQIGPFSFQVVIPPREHTSGARETRIRHLDRARRNLVRLALVYRKRLREHAGSTGTSTTDISKHPEYQRDLSQKASGLRLRVKDYERRLAELELAEREVAQDRELLNRELEAVRTQAQRADQDISRRREEVEALWRARQIELKQTEERLRGEEKRLNAQRERLVLECKQEDREYLHREIEDLRARAQRTDQELARRRLEFEAKAQARHHELTQYEERLQKDAERLEKELQRLQNEEERLHKDAEQLRNEAASLHAEREHLTADRNKLEASAAQAHSRERHFEEQREHWHQQLAEMEKREARLNAERAQLTAERNKLEASTAQVHSREHDFDEQREHWQHQRAELEKLAAHLQQALVGIREFHNGTPAHLPENATVAQ